MEKTRPVVLIAEDQIFIALEAERILGEALDCQIEICRRDQLGAALKVRSFDLVVLEFTGNLTDDLPLASMVQVSGTELAILCPTDDLMTVGMLLPHVPHVEKPFNEADFRAFVERFAAGLNSLK